MKKNDSANEYFVDANSFQEFDISFGQLLQGQHQKAIAHFFPPENTQHYKHGGGLEHPNSPEVVSNIQQMSTEAITKFDDLIQHRVDTMFSTLNEVSNAMTAQMMQFFFGTISDVCDTTGNVVDAKAEGSTAEAFAAMIEKIEFGVDKDGNVSLPQIVGGSEFAARMEADMKSAPPELLARIEQAIMMKVEQAQAKEVERRAKFVGYGAEKL